LEGGFAALGFVAIIVDVDAAELIESEFELFFFEVLFAHFETGEKAPAGGGVAIDDGFVEVHGRLEFCGVKAGVSGFDEGLGFFVIDQVGGGGWFGGLAGEDGAEGEEDEDEAEREGPGGHLAWGLELSISRSRRCILPEKAVKLGKFRGVQLSFHGFGGG
jgi:hypothetical protein